MTHSAEATVAAVSSSQAPAGAEGRYLYCVADAGEKVSLGPVGLEGREVYTIPYRDLCAVAHSCAAAPYQSQEVEVVRAWALSHQRVVDLAWGRWGTVLPMGFDTIVQGEAGAGAEEKARAWLQQEYDRLKAKIDRLRGKAEYGVQVFWQPGLVARKLAEGDPELRRLQEEIRSSPRGLAFLLRQKLESLLKQAMEREAERCFRDLFHRIRKQVEDLRVEKIKGGAGEAQMIINLSCLASREALGLGEELEGISRMEGFSVRFTGPWPPYSFVGG